MAIEVMKPGQQNTSMGRRLVATAAPIVGGIYGGPWGAAAGSAFGNKLMGQSTQDALVGAAGNIPTSGDQKKQPSAYDRRLNAIKEDPQVALNDGLSVLSTLPNDNPMKKEVAPYLIRAQMSKPRY